MAEDSPSFMGRRLEHKRSMVIEHTMSDRATSGIKSLTCLGSILPSSGSASKSAHTLSKPPETSRQAELMIPEFVTKPITFSKHSVASGDWNHEDVSFSSCSNMESESSDCHSGNPYPEYQMFRQPGAPYPSLLSPTSASQAQRTRRFSSAGIIAQNAAKFKPRVRRPSLLGQISAGPHSHSANARAFHARGKAPSVAESIPIFPGRRSLSRRSTDNGSSFKGAVAGSDPNFVQASPSSRRSSRGRRWSVTRIRPGGLLTPVMENDHSDDGHIHAEREAERERESMERHASPGDFNPLCFSMQEDDRERERERETGTDSGTVSEFVVPGFSSHGAPSSVFVSSESESDYSSETSDGSISTAFVLSTSYVLSGSGVKAREQALLSQKERCMASGSGECSDQEGWPLEETGTETETETE
ncbi:hypothetical protein KIPB_009832, partial [Kipferlia bialata]|eukprot:g9832.t1